MPTVAATWTRQAGRYLLSSRDQHLVADATVSRGGPGEAWTAAELLLGALVTCAHAVVESAARDGGLPLADARIDAESEADAGRPGHYAYIRLRFELHGLTQAQAETLVANFTSVCPIYGSLSRGAPLAVTVRGLPVT